MDILVPDAHMAPDDIHPNRPMGAIIRRAVWLADGVVDLHQHDLRPVNRLAAPLPENVVLRFVRGQIRRPSVETQPPLFAGWGVDLSGARVVARRGWQRFLIDLGYARRGRPMGVVITTEGTVGFAQPLDRLVLRAYWEEVPEVEGDAILTVLSR